jgi:hypothetical protein
MEKSGNLRDRSDCRSGERFSFVRYITIQEIAQVRTECVPASPIGCERAARSLREPDAD